MDIKEAYTKTFMVGAGETDLSQEAIKKNFMLWWQNTRMKGDAGLRLTKMGFEYAVDSADLQSYEIGFPNEIQFTPQVFLYLDEFIDCPYYVTKKRIYVFSEKMALQLMMFAGDIKQYGLARAMAKELSPN
jgi:hypothetical protein